MLQGSKQKGQGGILVTGKGVLCPDTRMAQDLKGCPAHAPPSQSRAVHAHPESECHGAPQSGKGTR